MAPCILNLQEGEWSDSYLSRFTPKETAHGNHCRSKCTPPSKYITPTGVRTRIPLSSNPCPSHYTDYMAHIHSYLQQHVISHYQCWIHTTDDTFSSQLRATAVVLGSTSPQPLHEICKCDVTNFSRILFFLLIFV